MSDFIYTQKEVDALFKEFIEDLESNWLEGKKKMIEKWKGRISNAKTKT